MVDALLRDRRVGVQAGIAEVVTGSDQSIGPRSLAAAIADRLGFLSEPALDVLRLASVLGPEFSVGHLGVLTGSPATVLATVIDEAVAAGVVVGAGDRLGFRHGLIRQSLYQGMPGALRSALHRQAAAALHAVAAPIEQVASHLLAAPDAAEDWVTGWLAEAAPALAYRAPQLAATLLERVRDTSPLVISATCWTPGW